MFVVGQFSGFKFDSLPLRQERNFRHNSIVPAILGFPMFSILEKRIAEAISARIRSLYDVETQVQIEQPKQSSFGELALPAAFQLARQLKKAPKAIATEIAAAGGPIEGVASMEIAGNDGYDKRSSRTVVLTALECSKAWGAVATSHRD